MARAQRMRFAVRKNYASSAAIAALMAASSGFMCSSVSESSRSSSQPSIEAPPAITSREQPAAKDGVLNFFLRIINYRC